MRLILPAVPILAAILIFVFPHHKHTRAIGVLAIAFAMAIVVPYLIAPHRVAGELVHGSPQSEEWIRGALDTRNAVYMALPTLASGVAVLVALALTSKADKERTEQNLPAHARKDARR